MKLQIKSRYNSTILFEGEADNIRQLVEIAVKNKIDLSGADLRGANLSNANLSLSNTKLSGANLSGANLGGANLRNAKLKGAYLFGANLRGANLSNANLSSANLRYANLKGTDLIGANLTGADLRSADLFGADLSGADLSGTILPDAPKVENLDKKILKAIEEGGKLDMDNWHTCETTHCRAGWAIHLAGQKGKELENRFGPAVAGALIYHVSTGYIPDFFATDEKALKNIKECAAK